MPSDRDDLDYCRRLDFRCTSLDVDGVGGYWSQHCCLWQVGGVFLSAFYREKHDGDDDGQAPLWKT